jgi:hypothetical protein
VRNDDEIVLTNSAGVTWQDCKRRWFLGYYLGYKTPPERVPLTSAMSLGTRLHKALELHYGYDADPRAALGVIYGSLATDDIDEAIAIQKEKTLALTMIDGYLEWAEREGADYDLTLVSTELDVTVESGAPGIRFRGKLDQVVQRTSDGALLFHDWKTTGSFDMIVPTLHLNAQARFYTMLNLLMAERDTLWPRVDGGLFTMLRRTQRTARATPPFYRREEVRFNDNELRATQYKAIAVAREIQTAQQYLDHSDTHQHVAYPNPTRDCTWKCPFVRICPLMDDGSDWRGAADANYVVGDPYDYYDGGDNAQILGQIEARKGTDR